MSDEKLMTIYGGVNSSLINSVARLISFLFEFGQSIGSALRMIKTNKSC